MFVFKTSPQTKFKSDYFVILHIYHKRKFKHLLGLEGVGPVKRE